VNVSNGAFYIVQLQIIHTKCTNWSSLLVQFITHWSKVYTADAWQSPLAWPAWARQVQSHHLDSSLPHPYRATVSSCRLCSGLRDGTETSSTLRRWSSALVPSYRLNSCGLRAFSVLGPRLSTSFGHSLMTFFLSEY